MSTENSNTTSEKWVRLDVDIESRLESVHFVDENHGWIAGVKGVILHTNDGGQNWKKQDSGTENHLYTVRFVDRETGWAVGSEGIILYSDDGGQTWQKQDSGTESHLSSVEFIDRYTGWAVGSTGLILHTDDSGHSWQKQDSGTESHLSAVEFINRNTGWAIGGKDGDLLHTKDGGENWELKEVDSHTGSIFIDMFFLDKDTGWILSIFELPDATGRITFTTDGGENWETVHLFVRHYSMYFTDAQTGWMVGPWDDGIAWHTTDGGKNWDKQNGEMGTELNSVFMIDNYTGWAVGVGGVVMHYANNPALPAPLLVTPVENDENIEQPVELIWEEVVSAESYRVQVSPSRAFNTRERDESGISATSVQIDGLEEGRTYFWRVSGTNKEGGSHWSEVGTFIAGKPVSANIAEELPDQLVLHQNYPNPFNPVTTIAFELPEPTPVTLQIIDVTGSVVKTLVDQTMPAGVHQVAWDASNAASGLYLYRLHSGDFTQTRSMTLVK